MKFSKAALVLLVAACGGSSEAPPQTAANVSSGEANTEAASEAASAAPSVLTNEQGQAVSGYDVVSYHQGTPARGDAAYSVEHDGATYLFSSAENRDAFTADPERYVPAYGGWCAFAVAEMGSKAPIDPETYRIQDGRLLLFFNGEYNGEDVDTSALWDQSPDERLRQADERWPAVQSGS